MGVELGVDRLLPDPLALHLHPLLAVDNGVVDHAVDFQLVGLGTICVQADVPASNEGVGHVRPVHLLDGTGPRRALVGERG
eukprot:16443382-Heterocapsa_arctica.AAC.1